ncbi:MAG: enolase C-terminal domain-like protein [Pseudomonadota bacterium]
MHLKNIALTRCRIPFKQSFSHAAAKRVESDVIHIEITNENGSVGFGEIQARPYVTGESNDSIWNEYAPKLAENLLSAKLNSKIELDSWLEQTGLRDDHPACVGGFDMAFHDLLELEAELSWNAIFGNPRSRPAGRCLTIDGAQERDALVRAAKFARLTGCSATKLKVANTDDIERCHLLREHLGPEISIRLDGNGQMALVDAIALLDQCRHLRIESLEEPLNRSDDAILEQLTALHQQSGVDLVADESAVDAGDVHKIAKTNAFQVINVRIGKCGGISGTQAVIEAAKQHGLKLVCGTMVGESAVLLRYSKKLLQHCDQLDYVEGIDQNKTLLADEVVVEDDSSENSHFAWQLNQRNQYQIGTKIIR